MFACYNSRPDTGYPSESEKLWSMEKMKTYFCLIRTLQPALSDAGNQVLLRYYQMQRQSGARSAARTTIRLLESLIRLAEGGPCPLRAERARAEREFLPGTVPARPAAGSVILPHVAEVARACWARLLASAF